MYNGGTAERGRPRADDPGYDSPARGWQANGDSAYGSGGYQGRRPTAGIGAHGQAPNILPINGPMRVSQLVPDGPDWQPEPLQPSASDYGPLPYTFPPVEEYPERLTVFVSSIATNLDDFWVERILSVRPHLLSSAHDDSAAARWRH